MRVAMVLLVTVAAVSCAFHVDGLVLAAPQDPLLIDQDERRPSLVNLPGGWSGAWGLLPTGRRFGVHVAFEGVVRGDFLRDDVGYSMLRGPMEFRSSASFMWTDMRTQCTSRLQIKEGDYPCRGLHIAASNPGACSAIDGPFPFRLPKAAKDIEELEGTTGQPRCGPRMVEILENRDNYRAVTCVDRAHEGAQSLSLLEIAIDPSGHPLWLVSPAPWGGDSYGTDYGATLDLDWVLPETCEPYAAWFPPKKFSTNRIARANRVSGLTFEWDTVTPYDADLLSVQAWHDDRETGAFVLFHADLKPATLGYKIDGQPHGLWTYFDRDARLIDARVYALGTFLMTLPIVDKPALTP